MFCTKSDALFPQHWICSLFRSIPTISWLRWFFFVLVGNFSWMLWRPWAILVQLVLIFLPQNLREKKTDISFQQICKHCCKKAASDDSQSQRSKKNSKKCICTSERKIVKKSKASWTREISVSSNPLAICGNGANQWWSLNIYIFIYVHIHIHIRGKRKIKKQHSQKFIKHGQAGPGQVEATKTRTTVIIY